ncbi:Ribosomal RNA small subunit methyltransferase NEP1 [Holothuria leucospilota]|uniref:Ribosomal RNA small subunit methyltransferase NEP1 n=1 Tax=Holothuria leucospilota TaxID=206669 RepID=A0A9Q1CCY9_HOLLE|nr:Ribosomal RNA small subunit methyltransferase NEP1 [Holothuria leucospilota]
MRNGKVTVNMAARSSQEAELDESPTSTKIIKTIHEKNEDKRLIVILENASLETIKTKDGFELLNCDRLKGLLKKHKLDPAKYRPDIAHQCLLMLFDSPLNRAGLLQVFVHTTNNALIQISPQTRIPRTMDRFSGLMVQLLHKLSIHASNGPQKLMKIIKNPVSSHLPVGCKKYSTSFAAKKCVKPHELAAGVNEPVVVVIGAMAHGKLELDYTDEEVAISQYPLSAALTCAKICSGFEEAWGIH